MFTVTGTYSPGDAYILVTSATGTLSARAFPSGGDLFNLNGWWEIMGVSELTDPSFENGSPNPLYFTTDTSAALKQYSWVIFVRKIRQLSTSAIIGYEVHTRDVKLTIESPTTKFWYNNVDQLIDGETKKRVYDNIKVLRSNLNYAGAVLGTSQIYDVVGAVRDQNGIVDLNKLEIVPSDMLNEDASGDLVADRILQFETFAGSGTGSSINPPSYEYYLISSPNVLYSPPLPLVWANGSFVDSTLTVGRRLRMPSLVSGDAGLDFMWQHFTPFTNIIDPSVTNIHDMYLMTRGYYDNVISYVRGTSTTPPTPPTPLDLRNSYGSLLNSKMLSDTIVLHSGKIRLLFGSLAEPQLRAKFKVVRQPGASLTNERIKEEVLNVINTFFDIDGWDFGDKFYATELITLIHQRLPSDLASVVLVPIYSTNSFGSLFTVDSGHDEILQSAAQLSDIEVVDALTPTVIRQIR
jgi:hypothetical protein